MINEEEAVAVKLIYQMIIEGYGYNAILTKLCQQGYKTKIGRDFGKNSLYEILRNQKYKGVYVYNRVAEADPYTRRRNSHQWNDERDMIIVPDGVPAIVSEEDFALVQQILTKRRRDSSGAKHHKEVYLLTGKIFCGECGCRYSGNRKNSVGNKAPNITYRCNNRARKTGVACHNKEVNRDYLESFVLQKIEAAIFNKKMVSIIMDKFQNYIHKLSVEKNDSLRRLEKEIHVVEERQNNLSDILADGCTDKLEQNILLQKLKSLEIKKLNLQELIEHEKIALAVDAPNRRVLEECFIQARSLFRAKKLEEQQVLINLYVERVIVNQDQIEVILNLVPSFYKHDFTREVYDTTRKKLREFFYKEAI